MQLEISSRGFGLTDPIRTHVQERMARVLRPATRRVRAAKVMLLDVNGPRGGLDKQCRIELHLGSGGTVRIGETDRDLYAAIDRAAGRLKQELLQRLQALRARLRGRA